MSSARSLAWAADGEVSSAEETQLSPDDASADSNAEPAAQAAPSTEPRPDVEEIVITGNRVLETELDAPVSVTSFDAEELTALGVENVGELAAFTPNLEVRTAGATSTTFFIRGVGLNDFTSNASGAVAIYQDDVALNLPAIQLAQLFDVQSVEVLRGPQGSGPGRNASAGAIHIQTNKPTGELGAFFRSEFGNYDSRLFEGAVDVPIAGEMLATRLAFIYTDRDPFLKNGCGNAPPQGLDRVVLPDQRLQPQICGENVRETITNPDPPPPSYTVSRLESGLPSLLNDRGNWAARGQLRFTPPGSPMNWLFNVHGGKIDQYATLGQSIGTLGAIGGVDGFFGGLTAGYRQPEIAEEEAAIFDKLGGNDLPPGSSQAQRDAIRAQARTILSKRLAKRLDKKPFRGDYNRPGFEHQSNLGGFLRGDFELDSFHLASLSAYESYDRSRNVDGDYTPNVVFEDDIQDKGWQFTQDLRLEGELPEAAVRWNAGAYYLMDHLEYADETITGPALTDLTREFQQKTWSVGAYAGFLWDFLDRFALEGGIRYNWERKDFDVELLRSGASACPTQPCHVAGDWHAPTGTISLTYNFTDDFSSYVKYSRGWKGPQFNAGGASGRAITRADPEVIDAWEVGLAGTWLDGRSTGKLSLFYYDYQDYQVFITQNDRGSPPQRIVINADDAQNLGAEVELLLEPLEGLSVDTRFGWLETKFLNFSNQVFRQIPTPQPPPVVVPVSIDYTGNRLPNAPRFKVNLSVEYHLDLGRFGSIVPRYDYVWTDDSYFDPSQGRGSPNNAGQLYMPKFAIGQQAFGLHNVWVAYRTPEDSAVQVEVAGWVRNLTNQVYKTLAFDASTAANLVGSLVGDPRTYGVSFTVRY